MRRPASTTIPRALAILAIAAPAMAQHPAARKGGAAPNAGHAAPHVGSMPGRNPVHMPDPMEQQFHQQMQQQWLQEQQRIHQQQVHQEQLQAQAHQKAMTTYSAWLQSQGQSAGSSSLPSSPAALKKWAETQGHKKAMKQGYDPTFDSYQQFQAAQKAPKAHSVKPGASISAGSQALANSQAGASSKAPAPKGKSQGSIASKAPAPKPNGAGSGQSNLPLAQDQPIIGLLRTMHLRLHGADNDYDGYRIQAMANIHQALRELGSAALAHSDADRGHGNLPQGQSDAILREVAEVLKRVDAQLAARSNASEAHARARGQVQLAVKNLGTATSIR